MSVASPGSTPRRYAIPWPADGEDCRKRLLHLLHGTSGPIDGCPCQKTFQTGLSSKLELFHAGSGKWLSISTDPIRDAAGNIMVQFKSRETSPKPNGQRGKPRNCATT